MAHPEQGGDAPVLIRREGPLGRITLNRPKAINALTLAMVDAIAVALTDWRHDPAVKAIVFDGAGERGFCAGGDIRAVYETRDRPSLAVTFWRREYTLNHAISAYSKPVVAFMSGLVMGGGVGLAGHASHSVADETTRFAMPETGIGLFPDVGATWLLSRCPGEAGTWLGLTGSTIGAADLLASGLARHAIASTHREAAVADLASALANSADPFAAVTRVLESHAVTPVQGQWSSLAPVIERSFAGQSVEDILQALEAEGGAWAGETAATIRAKSPLMQKVTLRALRRAASQPDLASCLRTEFRIVCRVAVGTEFYEGVRAAVIDKDRTPRWNPARLAEVDDARVNAFFAPLDDELVLPGA